MTFDLPEQIPSRGGPFRLLRERGKKVKQAESHPHPALCLNGVEKTKSIEQKNNKTARYSRQSEPEKGWSRQSVRGCVVTPTWIRSANRIDWRLPPAKANELVGH